MSWYSTVHEPTKQLNALIQTNPSLATLLMYSDFIKLFNQNVNYNLQNYLRNTPSILSDIITYISVAPNQSDSIDRKHKLPLLTIQMIEIKRQFMSPLILRPNKQGISGYLTMFNMFKSGRDVLPLLAGYFNRASVAINSILKKQALDFVYSSPQYMELLIQHSYDASIARTLKQYLSIQLTNQLIKYFPQEKTPLKLTMIRNIMNKIQSQRTSSEQRSVCLVSNLFQFIREEILEKYDMIYHGKSMVDIILSERYVDMIMGLVTEQSENSLPAVKIVFMCLRYYANCCYRMPNQPQDNLRQRVQKLQNEPFIRKLIASFKITLQKIKNKKEINLYTYNILNVLCHAIKLPMVKIFTAVKESSLIPILIDLLFRFEDCNILHKLIEGLFEELFLVQNSIYDLYKEYLFCTVSIIDLTAIRLYKSFPEADGYEKARKKGYFGPLIQIINKYSRIMAQTTNPLIKNQVNAYAQICQKFSQKIMKPHELIWKNKLGEYENVPKVVPLEYAVIKTGNQFVSRSYQNAEAVEQVKKQEQGMTKLLQTVIQMHTYSQRKNYDDSFYKNPIEDVLNKNVQQPGSEYISSNYRPVFSTPAASTNNQEKPGFQQMMIKFKEQVGEQNRQKKSQSLQKRLSAGKKTRLTSPSPVKKRNSWKQQSEQETKQQKAPNVYVNKDLPKVPIAPTANKIPMHTNSSIYSSSNHTNTANNNHLAKSSVQEPKKSFEQESKRMMSLSTANLEVLKKTTIIRTTQIPAEKKYRKIQDKDKALFAYLGINC